MGIIVDKACGLDVHKETAVACIMESCLKTETNALKSNPYIVCMDSDKKKGYLYEGETPFSCGKKG